MLRLPIEVSYQSGGAPMGDAMLAAHSTGRLGRMEDVMACFLRTDEVIDPVSPWQQPYEPLFSLYEQVRENLQGSMAQLHEWKMKWGHHDKGFDCG